MELYVSMSNFWSPGLEGAGLRAATLGQRPLLVLENPQEARLILGLALETPEKAAKSLENLSFPPFLPLPTVRTARLRGPKSSARPFSTTARTPPSPSKSPARRLDSMGPLSGSLVGTATALRSLGLSPVVVSSSWRLMLIERTAPAAVTSATA